MNNILDKIIAHKRNEVEQRKQKTSLKNLCQQINELHNPLDFVAAINDKVMQHKAAVIAEIKKASPSKSVIREHFEPIAIAQSYLRAGATCLSILTDEHFFQGHDKYLRAVRAEY